MRAARRAEIVDGGLHADRACEFAHVAQEFALYISLGRTRRLMFRD